MSYLLVLEKTFQLFFYDKNEVTIHTKDNTFILYGNS